MWEFVEVGAVEGFVSKRYEVLLALFGREQLMDMERVREALLADPKTLDNRESSRDDIIAAGLEESRKIY